MVPSSRRKLAAVSSLIANVPTKVRFGIVVVTVAATEPASPVLVSVNVAGAAVCVAVTRFPPSLSTMLLSATCTDVVVFAIVKSPCSVWPATFRSTPVPATRT